MNPFITDLFPELIKTISGLQPDTISNDRKSVLKPLINWIQSNLDRHEIIRLNFICTHNSRRSHLAQIWTQTFAAYFKVDKVYCYSAGTQVTALYPMIVNTLERSGFQVEVIANSNNKVYSIKYGENASPIIGFSKKITDNFNPKKYFAAIMTCDAANEACPYVPGADIRIPVTYDDPKVFDETPHQIQHYSERSLQIATEMFYVFSKLTF